MTPQASDLVERLRAIDFAEHKTAFRERVRQALALSREEFLRQCNFAEGAPPSFKVVDAAGEHDPCYLVLPGGSMLPLNHFADELTDVCRAIFIAEACNAALADTIAKLEANNARLREAMTGALPMLRGLEKFGEDSVWRPAKRNREAFDTALNNGGNDAA